MQEHNGKPVEHLGDGVYALYDYTGIWLHANDHANPTDKIFIQPSVLKNLNEFQKNAEDWIKYKKTEVLCPKCSCQSKLIKDRERECLRCKLTFWENNKIIPT
jgi:hypothetical protein